MSPRQDNPEGELPSLANAPWLASPSTQAVLAALERAGFEGRVVGGCVRNALMGLPVADIDVATPATPEQVLQACATAGLATVPTGLEHGTVTVIAHHLPIEVTTLRRDVATDGRRAVVAFTNDWAADAQRRDFTMNALYCDGNGRVYDYVGGFADLTARRIRFIGDADQRIAEDYLRILRFFRFHATYASGAPDQAGLEACARGVAGVARLSAERIRAELVKLLVASGVVLAVGAMADIGLLPLVLGAAPRPDVLASVVSAEAGLSQVPDAMLRLSALAVARPDDISRIAARLRLSNDERRALIVIDRQVSSALGTVEERLARRLVYERGAAACRRLAIALAAVDPARRSEALTLLDMATNWKPPRLPVSGADLQALGIAEGPRIGAILKDLEIWWAAEDFPEEAVLRRRLAELITSGKNL